MGLTETKQNPYLELKSILLDNGYTSVKRLMKYGNTSHFKNIMTAVSNSVHKDVLLREIMVGFFNYLNLDLFPIFCQCSLSLELVIQTFKTFFLGFEQTIDQPETEIINAMWHILFNTHREMLLTAPEMKHIYRMTLLEGSHYRRQMIWTDREIVNHICLSDPIAISTTYYEENDLPFILQLPLNLQAFIRLLSYATEDYSKENKSHIERKFRSLYVKEHTYLFTRIYPYMRKMLNTDLANVISLYLVELSLLKEYKLYLSFL